MGPIKFSTFDITSQVFLKRLNTVAFVNLKPIVPLHVLVIPTKKDYKRLREVPTLEIGQLFHTVQIVVDRLEEIVGAQACTVSIQDGEAAGQSVPHLHVHVLPRKVKDFTSNDQIYPKLEEFGLGLHKTLSSLPSHHKTESGGKITQGVDVEDKDRRPRTLEEMTREAKWLSDIFKDVQQDQ